MRFQKLLPNNLAGVLNEKSNFSLVEYVDISRSLPNYRLPAKLLFKPKRKKFCFEAFATSTIWLVKTIYFNWLYISFYFFSKSFVVVFYGVIFVSGFNIRFFFALFTVELLAWNCLIGQILDLTCHVLYHGSFIFPLFHIDASCQINRGPNMPPFFQKLHIHTSSGYCNYATIFSRVFINGWSLLD